MEISWLKIVGVIVACEVLGCVVSFLLIRAPKRTALVKVDDLSTYQPVYLDEHGNILPPPDSP